MYKILSRKVTPTDKAPEPYKEEEVSQQPVNSAPPVTDNTPAWRKWTACEHGYYMKTNCRVCAEKISEAEVISPPFKPDNEAAARLLMLPNKVDHHHHDRIIREPEPDLALYDELFPYSAVIVGCKVARRIKLHQVGVVTMIDYMFQDSKMIRQLWVVWAGKENATPYHPNELLRLRVQ